MWILIAVVVVGALIAKDIVLEKTVSVWSHTNPTEEELEIQQLAHDQAVGPPRESVRVKSDGTIDCAGLTHHQCRKLQSEARLHPVDAGGIEGISNHDGVEFKFKEPHKCGEKIGPVDGAQPA